MASEIPGDSDLDSNSELGDSVRHVLGSESADSNDPDRLEIRGIARLVAYMILDSATHMLQHMLCKTFKISISAGHMLAIHFSKSS